MHFDVFPIPSHYSSTTYSVAVEKYDPTREYTPYQVIDNECALGTSCFSTSTLQFYLNHLFIILSFNFYSTTRNKHILIEFLKYLPSYLVQERSETK